MKNLPICVALVLLIAGDLRAQSLGIGAGLAIPNNNIAQVTSDLAARGWSGIEEQAKSGYYIELRGRLGKKLGVVGGIGYSTFPEDHSQYVSGSGQTVTLQTSQSIIPVSLGLDMRLSESFVRPYISLEATYSNYYRSFSYPSSDVAVPFHVEKSNVSRYGAALGTGVDLDLPLIDLSLGARLQLTNLINKEQGEHDVVFLQLGAVAYFGL